jgi:hypothetical protein
MEFLLALAGGGGGLWEFPAVQQLHEVSSHSAVENVQKHARQDFHI